MPHTVTFVFIMAFVAVLTWPDGSSRVGFHLVPRSSTEIKGLALRAFQLLFLVAVYLLAHPHADLETVTALLLASVVGMIICSITFWKSNRSQTIFGLALLGFGILAPLLFPAVTN